jgi:enoyl-CoA hydratase
MSYKNFTVETDGDGIALVTWDMPNRSINVIDMEVIEELGKIVDTVTNDAAIKGAVVTSAKDTFSGGADLTMLEGLKGVFADMVRAQGEEAAMAKLFEESRKLSLLYRRMETGGKPWVAAINGTAVGGGLEMTLHCDLRFAATDARLGQPEINIGFIPPIATTQALGRLIGRPRALRYLYEGGLLQATEALEWGLVDELVEPGTLRARVQAYGEELASKSPAALAAIRRTVTLGGGMTFEDGMAYELRTVVELAGTPDFVEGVDAFLAKRQPKWKTP